MAIWCVGRRCINLQNFVKVCQTVKEMIWQFFVFFSRWRPSVIMDFGAHFGTIHYEYFWAFIIWQNLVGIHWRSFCKMKVWIFCLFGWEIPIHAPKISVLFNPLNMEQYQGNPQKAHPCVKTRRMTYRSLKSVHWCDLCAWLRNQKKERQRTRTVANWVFAQTTHVVATRCGFARLTQYRLSILTIAEVGSRPVK